ncbi:hypothetical protein ACFPK9_07235 [Rubritalea spongiae]|uniref:DUF4236 domain-containing protein n=1 Tax=Rubritalea spongiae TaxID=430797 RepID=A0ABW5E1B3_9BACT
MKFKLAAGMKVRSVIGVTIKKWWRNGVTPFTLSKVIRSKVGIAKSGDFGYESHRDHAMVSLTFDTSVTRKCLR